MGERELSELYPHFPIIGDVIESKRGDLTFGWELCLPAAFRCNEEAYDAIAVNIAAAVSLLPEHSIVHKQDIFMFKTYKGETSGDFLQDSYEHHFDGRRYLEHACRLYLTFPAKQRLGKGSGLCGWENSSVPTEDAIRRAYTSASQFESMIGSDGNLSLQRLHEVDYAGDQNQAGIIQSYLNFSEDGRNVMSEMQLSRDHVRVGDKYIVCHTITDLDQMPGEISASKKVPVLSTEQSDVNLSTFSKVSSGLQCEHIVNQVIYRLPQDKVMATLDLKRRRMSSLNRLSENDVYSEELLEFEKEVARGQKTLVGLHINILSSAPADEIESVTDMTTSALSQCGVTPVRNIIDTRNIFWSMIPGNAAGLGTREYMTMTVDAAACSWILEGYDSGVEDGNMKLCERLKLVPIRFDIQEVAARHGLIENYNVFLLGPSGSGKSFFMNKYVKSCYDNGQHVFLIDAGHSYRTLCNIISENTDGRDGVYYTYEMGKPISFNPFRNIGRFKNDFVSINFLYSLMLTLWKNACGDKAINLSATAMRYVQESVDMFIDEWNKEEDPVFNDYYKFLKDRFAKYLKEEDVDQFHFDFKSYLAVLEQFSGKKKYGSLLNSKENIDVLNNRFVVFEIDDIKDDKILFPVTTLVILDMFTEKMRNLDDFKALIIEEAWRALKEEQMAGFMLELWKTARKKRTSAVVVSQDLDDLVSSDILKEAIISNSAVKILLDQKKYLNDFDSLARLLSLSSNDRSMILSMNRLNPDPSRRREAFFNLGNNKSFVLSVEVSPEERYAYSSRPDDKIRLAKELEIAGNYTDAIKRMVSSDRK